MIVVEVKKIDIMTNCVEKLREYERLTSEEQEILFRFIHCFRLDDDDVEILLDLVFRG